MADLQPSQSLAALRVPEAKPSDVSLDTPNKISRAELRKSTRSVRNSNESDITRKSANTPRDVVRSARPSFESEIIRKSANIPRDILRSTRPSFESDARKSATTPRDALKSARSSFESDTRRSLKNSDIHGSGKSSHSGYSNDELHHREYVDAVVNGDLDNVQRGIELHKIDPNFCSTDGFNALFAASWEGHLHVVNYLLSKGSNVNVVVPVTKYSPTHAAATDGYVEVLKVLLDAGAYINSVNVTGLTPLMKATRSGHFDAVELLVGRDADIELYDLLGMTALHAACSDGHFEIAKFLLERGAKVNAVNNDGETPFYLCAASSCWVEEGHLACMQLLRENGANVEMADTRGKTPEAAAGEHLKQFFRLSKLQSSDPECVSLLKDDEYHLWFALIAANFESTFVKELIKLYPCLENCKDGHGRIAHNAASPLMKGAFFRTPLQSFKSNRSAKISRNPTRSNSQSDPTVAGFADHWMSMSAAERQTELMTLARDGELTESLVVMMSESVDLNCVDSYGWTPLYEAIHQGHLDVVKLLVMEGADVDHVDMAGWSPLYLAAYYGHLEIVKFLAVQGSDVKQTDKQGKRPIDVAQSTDIRDFLKNATNEIIKLKRDELIKRRGGSFLQIDESTRGYTPTLYSNGRRHSRSPTTAQKGSSANEDTSHSRSSSLSNSTVLGGSGRDASCSDVDIAAALEKDDDDDHDNGKDTINHIHAHGPARGRPRENQESMNSTQQRNTSAINTTTATNTTEGRKSPEGRGNDVKEDTTNRSDSPVQSVVTVSLSDDNRLLRFGVNPSQLHICISYCRHTKAKPELVAALTWQLREVHGYDVWLDKDGSSLCTKTPATDSDKHDNDPLTLSDHMKDVMAKSHTVIVCMSREYKSKQNCHKVAKYAKQRSTTRNGQPLRVHNVLMQQDYTTLSELCHPLFSHDDVAATAERLAALIGDTGKVIKVADQGQGTVDSDDQTAAMRLRWNASFAMGVVVDQLNTVVVGDPLVDRLDRSESGCEADDDDDHHKVVVVDTTDSQKYTKSIIEIAEKLRALGIGDVAGSERIDEEIRRSSSSLHLLPPDYSNPATGKRSSRSFTDGIESPTSKAPLVSPLLALMQTSPR